MFQGCVVEVKMQSGVVYEGILRAISPYMDIALKVAHDKSKVCLINKVASLVGGGRLRHW